MGSSGAGDGDGIAQTPAGHGVSLGEAVHHDGALGHAGQGGNGNMRPQAIVRKNGI